MEGEKQIQMAKANLPEEIIREILSRLPVKSIGRCRCVSKSWRTLLSSPHFIKFHLTRTKAHRLVFSWYNNPETPLTLHSIDPQSITKEHASIPSFIHLPILESLNISFSILGSCNGIVLCKIKTHNTIFLLNSSTRSYKELPTSPNHNIYRLQQDLYGFGYDSSVDDYKVVCISHHSRETKVNIYTVRTASWRRVELPDCPYKWGIGAGSGALFDGSLHWLAFRALVPGRLRVISVFLLEKEEFRDLEAPSNLMGFSVYTMGVCRGCLCMFGAISNDFWVMEEYGNGESWRGVSIRDAESHLMEPLWFSENDESCIFLSRQGKIVLRSGEEEFNEVDIPGLTLAGCVTYAKVCLETLVSPNYQRET